MDSKKISALIRASELGSLTAAAQELGYTQSGLTHMMNALENELGLRLLIRSKGGVRLSPEGQQLLPYMQAMAEAADALELESAKLRFKNVSALRLGAYSSVARHWVPGLLAEFKKLSPDTQITVSIDSITELYNAVRNDELDCAIVSYRPELIQGLNWSAIKDDELMAILPWDENSIFSSFPVERFEGAEFYMPSQGFELDIEPVFRSGSVPVSPIIHHTNMDDASIVSMVEHGLGMSILSKLVMYDMKFQVRCLPLNPRCFRSLGLISSEGRAGDRNIRRLLGCINSVV